MTDPDADPPNSPGEIARRIRALFAGDAASGEIAARRLGVSERALRISLDAAHPRPLLDVLVAVVQVFGVDPTWLMTGRYDAATHHVALEAEGPQMRAKLMWLISRVVPSARSRWQRMESDGRS